MKEILILAGLLLAVTVFRRFVLVLIGTVLGRAIGKHALAQQPDTIHLARTAPTNWRDADAANRLSSALVRHGFQDAGVHRVEELPGLLVQLLVKQDDSMMAAVYEHPKAGHWVDIAVRHVDGTSGTYCSSPPTGLDQRPGHPVVNAPGLDVSALFDRARSELPKRPRKPVSVATVVAEFERAYADSMVWRKKKGIRTGEVVNVANRMEDRRAA